MQQVWDQTGECPEALADGPELHEQAELVWNVFLELSAARPQGLVGPGAITYSEVESYQRLTGIRLRPVEVEALMLLDVAYRESPSGA